MGAANVLPFTVRSTVMWRERHIVLPLIQLFVQQLVPYIKEASPPLASPIWGRYRRYRIMSSCVNQLLESLIKPITSEELRNRANMRDTAPLLHRSYNLKYIVLDYKWTYFSWNMWMYTYKRGDMMAIMTSINKVNMHNLRNFPFIDCIENCMPF